MINFFKISLKDHWRVASFYPTPYKVVQKVLSRLSSESKYFLEYGAGSGAFTREILKRLPADGKLLAFETNRDFVEQLRKINDPRLVLFLDDVRVMPQNLNELGLPRVDVIISGIPFSRITKGERSEIIKNSWQLLGEKGVFVAYQVIPVIVSTLKKYSKQINWYFEPRNVILPYFVIFAEK